jgi:hypothetical protein
MGTANIQALGYQIFRCCALSILSIPFSGLFNAATIVATGKGLPDERKPAERYLRGNGLQIEQAHTQRVLFTGKGLRD